MTNKYVKNAREGAKGTDHTRKHKCTQSRKMQEDGNKTKEKYGMQPQPLPHPQTSTRFLYRGRQQEAAQGMTSMLKKKHESAFHTLSIGETQRGEVCFRRRNEKNKGRRHKTQNAKKKKGPAHALSLQGKKTWWDKRKGTCYASRMPRIAATHLQDLFFCFSNHADDRRREPAKV